MVAAGIWLPFVGADLADAMGWRKTFVGSLFVAGATSLPELVVTVAAIRIGALNMAIANLLGSNLFDMVALAIDDLVYAKGPILWAVSPAHAFSAASAVVMTGSSIVSLLYRPWEKTVPRGGLDEPRPICALPLQQLRRVSARRLNGGRPRPGLA